MELSPTLEAALRHNRDDVLSLYHLHSRLELRLRGEDPTMEAPDWLALGRHLLRGTRRADGWRALRRAAEEGSGQAAVLAGLLLARGLGRRRRYRTAERLLTALLERQPAEAHLTAALARLLEWRLGEPAAARELVAAALDGLAESSPDRSDLERRLRRLDARLARSRSAVSPAPPPRRAEGPSG